MKKQVYNLISVIYTFFHFLIIKLFHFKNFNYNFIERFSPNTSIEIRNTGKLKLGKMVRAHTRTRLSVSSNGLLEIGDNTAFNYNCMVTCHKKIIIGNDCTFGPGVLIYDHDHDYSIGSKMNGHDFKCDDVIIGNNCWIGANVIILRGTIIGDNCVIGAGTILKGKYADNLVIYNERNNIVKRIGREIDSE